jgi:hypothetical protein
MEATDDIGRRVLNEALEMATTGAHTIPACVAMRLGNIVRGMTTDAILEWGDESDLESAMGCIRCAFLAMVATIRGEEVRK